MSRHAGYTPVCLLILIMEKYFVNLYLFDQTSMMISGIVMIERRVETVTSREV